MSIMVIGGCGYVGSALCEELVGRGHDVFSVDDVRRSDPGIVRNIRKDFADLDESDLHDVDTVVLLAAHASVADAVREPDAAFVNNVVSFHRLLTKVGQRRLVYASSSSVYSGTSGAEASEDASWTVAKNMYDFSKFVDDGLATLSSVSYYGLRFGTVNGPSPNVRPELMLNRMVQTALAEGFVEIRNPGVNRPILAMKDLRRAVVAIIEGRGRPGIYNLASFNTTVRELGTTVASTLGVPLRVGEDVPTYDFSISTEKFRREFDFEFTESVGSVIADIVQHYRTHPGAA